MFTITTSNKLESQVRGPSHWGYAHHDCPTLKKVADRGESVATYGRQRRYI